MLANQQQSLEEQPEPEHDGHDIPESSDMSGAARPGRRNLSTISERTERTEPSPFWSANQRLLSLHNPHIPSSTTGTSLGQVIGEFQL